MAVATLFETEKTRKPGKQSFFRSMIRGDFGAETDLPRVTAPPRPPQGENDAPATPNPGSGTEAPSRGSAPLGRNAYLRGLEEVIRRTEREEVQDTLVSVSPTEVQKLVRKAAKAKARYLAAVLDGTDGEGLPDTAAVKSMEMARERHEALEAGLQNLLAEMRRGNVDIQGIDDDAPHPSPDF
jgi:hypothetical protein